MDNVAHMEIMHIACDTRECDFTQNLASAVQRMDSAGQQINHYTMDECYPLFQQQPGSGV